LSCTVILLEAWLSCTVILLEASLCETGKLMKGKLPSAPSAGGQFRSKSCERDLAVVRRLFWIRLPEPGELIVVQEKIEAWLKPIEHCMFANFRVPEESDLIWFFIRQALFERRDYVLLQCKWIGVHFAP
jgi:hypothetical protein